MSIMTQYDPYNDFDRTLNAEMLQTQIFGAYFSAIEFRKSNVNLTNVEIARRSGWSRSHITKIMARPQNWTIETISRMATALDLEFTFVLVDRTDRRKGFNANGLVFESGPTSVGRNFVRKLKQIRPNTQVGASTYMSLFATYQMQISQTQSSSQLDVDFAEVFEPSIGGTQCK